MSDIKIQPSATGTATVTLTAPVSNTARTITLPDSTGTILDSVSTLDATKLSGNLPALSAANLTSIPAGNLTGTVADARISALTASKLTGALPAIDGSNLTGTGSPSITDNGNATAITISSAERVTIDSTAGTDTLTLNRSGGANGWATLGFPSAKFEIDAKGAMKVAVDGSQKLYVSAHGLAFNGDTASANSLDDYEEGTWTPDLQFGTSNSGITYSSRAGRYTKIGDVVHVMFRCYLTSKGSSTGHARLTGFPYSIATVTGGVFHSISSRGQLGSNDEPMYLYMDSSYGTSPKFYMNDWDGSGNSGVNQGEFQNNSEIEACFTYYTNS